LTKLYGLIGFPLGHSRSADYFNARFHSSGLEDHHYRLFPISDVGQIHRLLDEYPDLSGFNVTIPYKEQIIPLLSGIDETAKEIGSVNVVLINRAKKGVKLTGFNTDAGGFEYSLKGSAHHPKALVLGTGGAAKAVAWVLHKAGTEVIFVSRNSAGDSRITYKMLWDNPGLVGEHTLIVNASPAGMFPDSGTYPDIPYERVGTNHLLYDLVYNPGLTLFLKRGAEMGAKVITGEEMFLRQAELSYSLFTR
jgi:shikimate dehydrogenase